jgi:CHAT domain-containing protein
VSDAATALLIAKFYELHIDARLAPPTALSRAQAWLRQATSADLDAYARRAAARGRLDSRQLRQIEQELSPEGLARSRNRAVIERIDADGDLRSGHVPAHEPPQLVRPYAHPYFWAGFIHTGL